MVISCSLMCPGAYGALSVLPFVLHLWNGNLRVCRLSASIRLALLPPPRSVISYAICAISESGLPVALTTSASISCSTVTVRMPDAADGWALGFCSRGRGGLLAFLRAQVVLPAGPEPSSPPAAEHEVGGLPDAHPSSISASPWSRSWLLPNPGADPLPSRPARLPQHDARSSELPADGKVRMLDKPKRHWRRSGRMAPANLGHPRWPCDHRIFCRRKSNNRQPTTSCLRQS